jgi:hypothetical protein
MKAGVMTVAVVSVLKGVIATRIKPASRIALQSLHESLSQSATGTNHQGPVASAQTQHAPNRCLNHGKVLAS